MGLETVFAGDFFQVPSSAEIWGLACLHLHYALIRLSI